MSERGLSDLIVTIMAAGEVTSLPVRDQRRLHEALAGLESGSDEPADRLWMRFGGRCTWRSDPGVGQRAGGVTPALWSAVSDGTLHVWEDGREAEYVLDDEARATARRGLLRLPIDEANLLYEVGARWASASTARKKSASAPTSPAGTRRARLA